MNRGETDKLYQYRQYYSVQHESFFIRWYYDWYYYFNGF